MSLGPGDQVLVWTNTAELPKTGTVKHLGNMAGRLVVVLDDEPDARDVDAPEGDVG